MPDPGSASTASAWSKELQALCPRAGAGIAAWGEAGTEPLIDGRPVDGALALEEASRRLNAARRLVVGGLRGDVQTARAALALADRHGARVVHRNQFAAQRNIFAVQGRGAFTTTLAEAKNRAGIVLVVGGDVTKTFPRILERLFAPDPAFADSASRRLVLLGAPLPQRLPDGVVAESADVAGLDLCAAVAALRACVLQPALPSLQAAVPAALQSLAQRMLACPYGVIVWAAPDIPADAGEILVEQLQALVQDLNRTTRWAALPLAGSDGDLSANAVATWQTGFAMPLEYGAAGIAYDPHPDYADADLLLWVDSLPGGGLPQLPGAPGELPVIVLGSRDRALALPARHVFLPAATPGISASGHLVRTDSVITMYARRVRTPSLPAAAVLLDQLCAALAEEARA